MKILLPFALLFTGLPALASSPCAAGGQDWARPPATGIYRGTTDIGGDCTLELTAGSAPETVLASYSDSDQPRTSFTLSCYLDKDTDDVTFAAVGPEGRGKSAVLHAREFTPDRAPTVFFRKGQPACRFR